jgi:hypothetical protein
LQSKAGDLLLHRAGSGFSRFMAERKADFADVRNSHVDHAI